MVVNGWFFLTPFFQPFLIICFVFFVKFEEKAKCARHTCVLANFEGVSIFFFRFLKVPP